MLVNAARRFPQTAKLWEEAEETAENVKISANRIRRDTEASGQSSSCPSIGSVLIVCTIVLASCLQTVLGTLTTIVINSQLSNSTMSEGINNKPTLIRVEHRLIMEVAQ